MLRLKLNDLTIHKNAKKTAHKVQVKSKHKNHQFDVFPLFQIMQAAFQRCIAITVEGGLFIYSTSPVAFVIKACNFSMNFVCNQSLKSKWSVRKHNFASYLS